MTDRIAQLKKLLEADPNDPFCLYGLGQEYAKAGDLDTAVQYYDRTIDADPNYCYAYFHKARALEDLNRPDEAAAALRTGLERAKASGDAKAAEEITELLESLGG